MIQSWCPISTAIFKRVSFLFYRRNIECNRCSHCLNNSLIRSSALFFSVNICIVLFLFLNRVLSSLRRRNMRCDLCIVFMCFVLVNSSLIESEEKNDNQTCPSCVCDELPGIYCNDQRLLSVTVSWFLQRLKTKIILKNKLFEKVKREK